MGGQSRDELMGFALSLIRSQQEDKSEQLVRSLTNWDYDIDHADEMNQTLLHFAAQVYHTCMIEHMELGTCTVEHMKLVHV